MRADSLSTMGLALPQIGCQLVYLESPLLAALRARYRRPVRRARSAASRTTSTDSEESGAGRVRKMPISATLSFSGESYHQERWLTSHMYTYAVVLFGVW